MTGDEVIAAVAKVLSGLQVPVSLGVNIGTAREPWTRIHNAVGFGWHAPDDYASLLRRALAEAEVT